MYEEPFQIRIQTLRTETYKKEEDEHPEMTQGRKWGKGGRQNNFRNEHLNLGIQREDR